MLDLMKKNMFSAVNEKEEIIYEQERNAKIKGSRGRANELDVYRTNQYTDEQTIEEKVEEKEEDKQSKLSSEHEHKQ